jgi:hypothetical protein
MKYEELSNATRELTLAMPSLFEGIQIEEVFLADKAPIGDWSNPEKMGILIAGDGVGGKSGVYCFLSTDRTILYIGKATKNNLHHRVWDHIKTPISTTEGFRNFPNHGFAGIHDGIEYGAEVTNGNVGLAIITVSDANLVSFIEVYLQTLHLRKHGRLPVFNKQIG